jgi:hypothetical protein
MDDIYILKENLTALELQDAIDDRITKLHAIICCMRSNYASELQVTDEVIHDVIACCCDLLEEIELLRCDQVDKLRF